MRKNPNRGQPGNPGQFAPETKGRNAPTPADTATKAVYKPESSAVVDYWAIHSRMVDDKAKLLALAEDRTTTAESMAEFARHPDPDVRMRAAYHDNTSVETLDYLSDDSDPRVRHFVAANSRASEPALERLTNDSDAGVRQAAQWSLESLRGSN